MISKFDSVDSIVHYLREPTLLVHSTITDSRIINTKKQQEKDLLQVTGTTPPSQLEGVVQILPKGRVRYGPITVNPRKQPSKTLFTGRRSKYEVLPGDEEEKRRDRRERNRVAATKCREKRENVLSNLEEEHTNEVNNNKHLLKLVNELQQRKLDLETIMTDHLNECLLMSNSSSMIFGDTGFLSSITDAPPLPLPTFQQPILYNDEEELSHFLDPTPILTNSAYNTDESNSILLTQPMTTSSIDRLINTLQSPTISMENNNNHSMLFNSAIGSSCAKQHSNSSDDDPLPPKCTNSYVY
jgi:hypothetical protein